MLRVYPKECDIGSVTMDGQDVPFISQTEPCALFSYYEIKIEENITKWGDVVKHIITTSSCPDFLLNMTWLVQYGLRIFKLGHGRNLSDELELVGDRFVTLTFGYGWDNLKEPFDSFLKDCSWPPAENYYGEEPLNLLKVCYYDDGQTCRECSQNNNSYDKCLDNSKENMIVLVYPAKEEKKLAFNKHFLIKYLTRIENKSNMLDPIARLPITSDHLEEISNGRNFSAIYL
jgi:hypothetical protein